MHRICHVLSSACTDIVRGSIDYGDGLSAYGSALMDPVTSVLVALVASERNDVGLALDTLAAGDAHPCEAGEIPHSDQALSDLRSIRYKGLRMRRQNGDG